MARPHRAVLTFLLSFAALYAGLCLLMFLTQRSQMYFPVPESNAPGATPVEFESGDATLKVWAVERPGAPALLYFGGNAEDVGGSIGRFAALLPRHALYFVNYRGYGGSTGEPTERALIGDALALYDSLATRHSGISVLGRSLGSGVAVQLAGAREVERLVLVTPFDSLARVAAGHFPWLPVRLLMLDRYDSARHARAITAGTLIVVAEDDEIVPRARSDALIEALPPRPRVVVLRGARHNDIDLDSRYWEALAGFLGT